MKNSIKTETHPDYLPGPLAPVQIQTEEEIIRAALAILKRRLYKEDLLHATSPEATSEYLTLKLAEREHEVFGILFLDNQHHLIADKEIFRGTIDGASVYPREVLKEALDCNAAAVIFYHNHPSGLCEPSRADDSITAKLKTALQVVDIRVLDHVIVGGVNTYSYAANGKI